MQLRRFEAYGFKSFADKVEIEFGKGVTAIVGPNGSGKSNISDAIRWVLGEQNIRNLRGTKTEDIIFAGSSERRPLNVAEVSLIFDNSDNRIPLDFNEVVITRRVYRSGESEYLINKAPCRLKDIHDLLGDIGLGRESMAIISQSKVDEVLNSRPEDRRLLFEDAAGITKFKHRKRDALRKLDDTEANITRVADIMAELENQLDPLAESAAKTEQFNCYHQELTACQVSLLLHKNDRAQAMITDICLEKESLTDQLVAQTTRLSASETETEVLTNELSDIEQSLQTQGIEIALTSAELEKADNRTAVLEERIMQKRLASDRVTQDLILLSARINEAKTDHSKLEVDLTEKKGRIACAENEISLAEAQLAALLHSITEKEHELAAANDSIFAGLQETSAQRNQGVNLERDLTRFRSRRNQLRQEQDEYQAKLKQALQQSEQLEFEYKQQADKLNALTQELVALSSVRASTEQKISHAKTQMAQQNGQLAQKQSRLSVLLHMQRDLEGFNRGSKSVLTSQAPWQKGICGAVAQLIDVPDQYLTATEIALGGALQNIITEDENTAKCAIAFLKQQNAGRVTFLPISTIKPRKANEIELQAARSAGSIGLASELIRCSDRYRSIIDHLLGRVIVVESLDHALTIAKQNNFLLRIVTLDGELINPGGAITGGSIVRRESSILGRTGEIRELEKVVADLKRQQEKSEFELNDLMRQHEISIQQESRLNSHRQDISLSQVQLAAYRKQAETDVSRLSATIETICLELSQCSNEENQLAQKLISLREVIASLEETDASRKQAIAANQADLRALQQEKEQLAVFSTDKKIALNSINQEIQSLEQMLKIRLADMQDIDRRVKALEIEKGQILQEVRQAEQELQDITILRQQLSRQKQQQDEQRLLLLGCKAGKLSSLQQAEKDCKELRRRTVGLESRLHELQLMLTRYELEAANCQTQLQDHYMLTLEAARQICRCDDPQTLASNIKKLETNIALLGPVNPAAIEEYTRVKERYGFLAGQYDDLLTAKQHLTSIIEDIDKTMGKRFIAAFAAINDHFGEIFPRLFGGGKAQMELSEPVDILTSGIEIYVQPPGKKQQNLALLSGGERALTVIAILFSLLAFRPSPFTVVDEIDAALDEANVQRFSEFLREFCSDTQFIVVTHRKGTMEVADVMHGVTMEESGVSRIVSVRFMDKAG